MGEFFEAAEALWHLAHELIVNVQHDRIAGSLDPQHRPSEQITSDAGDDILGPQAAIGAVAIAAGDAVSETANISGLPSIGILAPVVT